MEAVVGAPILRRDGSILQSPGYDAATRVLYRPEASFPLVPEIVTIADARAAMSVLEEPLADFPFATPAHRAAFFAALLTPVARFAFDGASPLFLIDANVAGAGKTLLGRLLGTICQGGDLAVASYSSDSSEMRKTVTTLVIDGKQVVLLDNIVGVLGNDALDRAITGGRWEDRLLGHNRSINLPLFITWLATGNNVQVSSDTTRRTLHIRLDILAERPEDRSEFKHPDLLQWVRANRERLYVAALTILSGYIQAGRPRNGLRRFGSFDGWSDLVREAVVWIGLPDPCETRQTLLESADDTGDAIRGLLDALVIHDIDGRGFLVGELIEFLYPHSGLTAPTDGVSVRLRCAVENFLSLPAGRTPTVRGLANRFRGIRRKVIDGKYLDVDAGAGRRDGARWKVLRTSAAPVPSPEEEVIYDIPV